MGLGRPWEEPPLAIVQAASLAGDAGEDHQVGEVKVTLGEGGPVLTLGFVQVGLIRQRWKAGI